MTPALKQKHLAAQDISLRIEPGDNATLIEVARQIPPSTLPHGRQASCLAGGSSPVLEEGDRTRDPGSIKLCESGILLYGSDRRLRRERPIADPLPICPFRDLYSGG